MVVGRACDDPPMYQHRVLAFVIAVILTGAACTGSDDAADPGEAEADESTLTTEPAAFRTVTSDDGNLIVRVPADDETEISVDVLDPSEWPEFLAGAEETPGVIVYDLQPSGATFEEPVHVFRKVEIANLGLDDLAPLDVPVAYLFTTDDDGAPELMDDPRILRTPDAIWVGGATDHFSPAGTVNQQMALSTDDVFRQLLSSVTDTEGERVIDVEPLVTDPPEVPDGGPPPVVTAGPGEDLHWAARHWVVPIDDARFRVEADFDPGDVDAASAELDAAFAALEEAGATVTDPTIVPAHVEMGDLLIRVAEAGLGFAEFTVEVGPDTAFAPSDIFRLGREPVIMRVGVGFHGPPGDDELGRFLERVAEEENGIPPDGSNNTGDDDDGATEPVGIPTGWDLRIEVVHTPLGPFPSFFFVPIDVSDPLPDGVFISTIETGGGEPGGDTILVNPVPVGPGPGPFEVETGIQCFCPYGLAVIGPTEIPVDEIRSLDTVGAVHDAGAPVNFLVGPSGDFTLAPVGPEEGPIFEDRTEPLLFVP